MTKFSGLAKAVVHHELMKHAAKSGIQAAGRVPQATRGSRTTKAALARRSYEAAFGVSPPKGLTPSAMHQAVALQSSMSPVAPKTRKLTPPTVKPAPSVQGMSKVATTVVKQAGKLNATNVSLGLSGLAIGRSFVEGYRANNVTGLVLDPVAVGAGLSNAVVPAATMVGIAGAGRAATAMGFSAQLVGRTMIGAALGIGAYEGIKEDRNVVRGAVRGAIRAVDPTSLILEKGVAQSAYDKLFGVARPAKEPGMRFPPWAKDPLFPQQYDPGLVWRGIESLRKSLEKPRQQQGAPSSEPSIMVPMRSGGSQPKMITANNGTYERTYTKGPKAGTTETVRKVAS